MYDVHAHTRMAAQADGVIEAARAMAGDALVIGTVGNVSARTADGFLITPSRTHYDALAASDLPVITPDGPVPGNDTLPPSREWPLHAAIYRARPDVGAVVHTHSVHATAWSFLDEPLFPVTEEIEYYGIGAVRTAPWNPAGSGDLGDCAAEALGTSLAVLLGRHGVVAVGATPDDALTVARVVEHQAQIAWLLRKPRGVMVPSARPQ
jgi:L-fuculose-phosphate aldolase